MGGVRSTRAGALGWVSRRLWLAGALNRPPVAYPAPGARQHFRLRTAGVMRCGKAVAEALLSFHAPQ